MSIALSREAPLSVPRITSVGIDVSKGELVVGVRTTEEALTPVVFENSRDGAHDLVRYLKRQETAATVPCVIESTGDFHLLSSFILSEHGFNVKCINPLITKQYQRSSVRNAKSDSIDALRLADIGAREEQLPNFEASISQLSRKKALASCALLEGVVQKLQCHIAQAERTAQQIGFSIDLSTAHAALKLLKKQIKQLTTVVVAQRSERALSLSKQIPGLTDHKLAVVDAHLAGRSFGSRDQLVAFAGLDVMTRQSGTWRGREHISKRGNAYLRKTLYHIAWGLARYSSSYKDYYVQLRAKGKHYTTCLMAIARKFLRFAYAWYFGSLRLSTTLALT